MLVESFVILWSERDVMLGQGSQSQTSCSDHYEKYMILQPFRKDNKKSRLKFLSNPKSYMIRCDSETKYYRTFLDLVPISSKCSLWPGADNHMAINGCLYGPVAVDIPHMIFS